jgi:5-methylcytosine-specific restriction endonuclease McrA
MANISDEVIEQVWQKAQIVSNNNPNVFRKDYAGAWIRRDQYGRRDLPYGWEVDHCRPLAMGGSDDLSNLYPLHWRNNQRKGNDYPNWKTAITSEGVKNVEVEKGWHM